MHLYDMIESQARFKLYTLRSSNEKKRMDAFNKSFFSGNLKNDEVLAARKEYIETIYNDMQAEIELYRTV
jgi:hypothetical protein